jgi:dTDP-4-amino-4,6-dideoxygalactose transaminase
MKRKSTAADLAVFGGRPAFDSTVHVGAPNIGNRRRLHELIDDALDRRWLSNDGPYVHAFERRLTDLLAVRNCVATCNATSGLMLLAQALDLRGEVIMPSLTFVATAHALTWQGVTPVFCDVDPATWTLDPARVEELITPRTAAIAGVHLWGTPCDVEGLQKLATRHGLKLIFDSAHALGSRLGDRPLGSFGDAEVFSFHATKMCNSFEGGAVVTGHEDLAARLRSSRNYGFVNTDRVESLGINAKMPELNAAMGLVSLDSFEDFVAVNRANFERYRTGLQGIRGVSLYDPPDTGGFSTRQYLVVEILGDAHLSRDDLLCVLEAENVAARRYFYPGCHRMEPYRTTFPEVGARLPVTEVILERVLVLPTGTATTRGAVNAICNLIALAVELAPEVRTALSEARAGQGR